MHARNRNPGNGYRSNPMGIGGGGGVAAGGQTYPNYNRGGFGRGQPKVFQPPPSRKGDVFMEAGKLATEYLIAKGLLPPNALNGKWGNHNNNLRNQAVSENGVSDAVSGTGRVRRRLIHNHNSATGSSEGARERRRVDSFKNPEFEWSRQTNRSEKVKGSPDKQGEDDAVSGYMEEQKSGKDGAGEEQKSVSGDVESERSEAGKLEPGIEKNGNELAGDDVGVKASTSHEGIVESSEKSDCSKNLNTSKEDAIMDESNGESEKPTVTEDTPSENSTKENGDNPANRNCGDLLTLIRFNKVPTKTRSSMTHKGSKIDPVLITEDEKDARNPEEPEGPLHQVSTDVPMGDAPSDGNQGLNPEPNVQEAPSAEEIAQFDDHKYKLGQGQCTLSQSFPERSTVTEQESGDGQPGFNRCSSVGMDRNEKRPLDLVDSGEGAKKPRDWAASNAQADDDYLHLSNSRGDQLSSQDGVTEPCNAYAEEKQLFPGSFKICDLNLMGVSDVHENHENTSSVLTFPSIGQPKQEPVSVNFDLSMSSIGEHHTRRGADGKEVEVIDLDCDSVQDDKVFNSADQKEDTIFTDLDSFPDSMQRVNDMPQDGYGLMISELLEADIPSSNVTTGVNSIHNEMGLQNEEGMLGDDESIYMSLGEIPISMPKL